jgi:hypothetical protein
MGLLFCLRSKISGGTRRSRRVGCVLRTAYGDVVLSSAQDFRWHKAFKDRRESVEDEKHAGRPSTARTENNVARVKVVLDRDRRLQMRLIAEELRLLKMGVHRIITEDLHMRNKFLPYGRSIGSWICLTHKTYTCHTVQKTYSASMAVSDSQSIRRRAIS